jgi:hypothetical protein
MGVRVYVVTSKLGAIALSSPHPLPLISRRKEGRTTRISALNDLPTSTYWSVNVFLRMRNVLPLFPASLEDCRTSERGMHYNEHSVIHCTNVK